MPCYNEQANIEPMYAAVTKVMKQVPYNYELIFIDDGSADETPEVLENLANTDKRVHPLELLRNFGKEIAVTAGLREAKGDAAIILDADLQHPPDLIPEFLDKWSRLADVVVGIRLPTKKHTSLPKRMFSRLFYGMMKRMTKVPVTPGATDYRLLDRLAIDEFNRFTERNRLTRGLIDWLGFRVAHVYFHPEQRLHGKATQSYRKLLELAVASFVSMSLVPLKISGYIGVIITAVSLPLGIFIVIEKYVFNDPWHLNVTGSASLGVLIVFLVGIMMIGQGLTALYIANIYSEVVNRPLFVVRRGRRR